MSNNRLLELLNEIQPDNTSLNYHLNSKVLIIDGLNTFLRSFAAVNHINQFGNHVGGLTGFLKSVGYAIDIIRPTRVIIPFDGEGGSVNKRYLYPEYKKNRDNAGMVNSKMHLDKSEEDKSKIDQISRLMDYLHLLPVNVICLNKFEADDVIGYMNASLKKKYSDCHVVIMSSDKDFLQLVDDRTYVYSPTKKKHYFVKDVINEFGVHPNNFLVYKTMLGDDSDNVKGIYGIGEKKALTLFPQLRENKELTLSNITKISKANIDKNKLYSVVIEGKSKLDINYQIMNLRKPNLSKEAISDIKKVLSSNPNVFRRMDFLKLHHLDDLIRSLQYAETWLNVFTGLTAFKQK